MPVPVSSATVTVSKVTVDFDLELDDKTFTKDAYIASGLEVAFNTLTIGDNTICRVEGLLIANKIIVNGNLKVNNVVQIGL